MEHDMYAHESGEANPTLLHLYITTRHHSNHAYRAGKAVSETIDR